MVDIPLTCKCPNCGNEFSKLARWLKHADSLSCPACEYSFTEAELSAFKAAIPDIEKGIANLQRDIGKLKNFKKRR